MDHLEWTIPSMDDDWGYPSRMLQIWGHGTSDEVKWLRESELKHGRVCMLATIGFVAEQYVQFPGA